MLVIGNHMISQSLQSEKTIKDALWVQQPVRLRVMVAEDKNALMSILEGTPEFKRAEMIVAQEVIGCYLNQGMTSGYHMWVAVTGTEEVIGYVCFGETPLTEGTWDIYWIAVAGTWRGNGVGKLLLQHSEGEVREKGGRMILIETSSKPEYHRARVFYNRMGYLPVSVITDFYASGDSKLTFQKLLQQ